MSLYAVHTICWRVRKDPAFREELRRDAATVLTRFDLTASERDAIVAGDVRSLEGLGAHGYLLANLGRFELFGLDRRRYIARIKGRE